MKRPFFITEFWTGPDGRRQLWQSEMTEEDPTPAIRAVTPEKLSPGQTLNLLIITFSVRHWTQPGHPGKNKL